MAAIIFTIASVMTAVPAVLSLQEAMSLQMDAITLNSTITSHQDSTINTKSYDNNNVNQQSDNNNCKSQHSNCSDSTTKNTIDGIRLAIPFP